MENFFFTQCAAVLFDHAPALDDVEQALDGWPIACPQEPAAGAEGWMACGPGFVVELRTGASVIVDVVDRPWPDDPRTASETPALGAAWRAGLFGPSSVPGALARAKEQSWTWEEGAAAADRHGAFVRLRTVLKLPADGPRELPKDHDPVHELTTLTEIAGALLKLRGASAFFLPGGESLRSREHVAAMLQRKTGLGPPPIELWLNLRAVGLGQEGDTRWVVVDVVGMRQLRLPDQEAIFAEGQEQPEALPALLRNTSLHLLAGKPIPDGSTADDARGRRWRASAAASGALPPDRPVLRWLPEETARPSEAMLSKLGPR
jgi:hypothetical protein